MKKVRIALLSDTICDPNGVSRFIQDMAKLAFQADRDFLVVGSTKKSFCQKLPNLKNIPPSLSVAMLFYKELDLTFPPISKISQAIDEFRPDLLHISTPGPMGLLGRWIALKKKIPPCWHLPYRLWSLSLRQYRIEGYRKSDTSLSILVLSPIF